MAATTKSSLVKEEHYVYSHITKIPGVCGGKATIDGRRVRVMDVVVLQQQGETPEQILEAYDFLNLAQIYAALSYYFENPEEIDAQLNADEERDARFEREKTEFLKHRTSSSSQ